MGSSGERFAQSTTGGTDRVIQRRVMAPTRLLMEFLEVLKGHQGPPGVWKRAMGFEPTTLSLGS